MPAVLIYVQHLLGIGHLMRARVIAEALADASFTPLRDADFKPIDDAYRDARRTQLLAAYEAAAPVAVLFETFPFGRRALRFELVPRLERIDASRPRPLVVASVREILQAQPKIEREREMLDWAARWFDAILVHGDPRFARLEHTYPMAASLAPPIHYTGFVLTPTSANDASASAIRDQVVVSAGGGGVGIDLLATALAAQRHSRYAHLTWRVLAGPNIPEAGYQRLVRDAGPHGVVERARVDFQALLRNALVSISQGGYNTVLDVVTSGARPVVVPFTGNGETEQRERGNRLRDFGLAVVVDDRSLTPESLAAAVDDAGSRTQWARWDFDSDGGAATAAYIARSLAAGRPRERAQLP